MREGVEVNTGEIELYPSSKKETWKKVLADVCTTRGSPKLMGDQSKLVGDNVGDFNEKLKKSAGDFQED